METSYLPHLKLLSKIACDPLYSVTALDVLGLEKPPQQVTHNCNQLQHLGKTDESNAIENGGEQCSRVVV